MKEGLEREKCLLAPEIGPFPFLPAPCCWGLIWLLENQFILSLRELIFFLLQIN